MPDTPKFVVNDRRKFTSEGELRHDAVPSTPPASAPETLSSVEPAGASHLGASSPERTSAAAETAQLADLPESSLMEPLGDGQFSDEQATADDYAAGELPPGPTAEQNAEATRAYNATVDRLDTAMRAADPGGERMPVMSFDRLVQSLYTQALMLLGGGAQPGETPRVDILGARQTIDMITVIADRTKGNLDDDEAHLLESALFDLRMGFLEITQALARQAAQRGAAGQPNSGGISGSSGMGSGGMGQGGFGGGAGPRIVR